MTFRVAYREWKKICTGDIFFRIICIFFLLIIAAEGYFAYWGGETTDFRPEEYTEIVSRIEGIPTEKALTLLKEEMQQELSGQGTYSPAKQEIIRELEEVSGYENYLKQISSVRTGGLMGEQKDGYERMLEKEYQKRYAGLSAKDVSFVGGRGVMLFLKTGVIDVFAGILVLLIVFRIVTMEYETKMSSLLACAKNGTHILVRGKWIAGGILSQLFLAGVFLGKLFIFCKAYHFTAWDARIQSVSGYQAVTGEMTVGVFVLLFLLAKLLGFLLLYTLFFLIAILVKSQVFVIVAELAFSGISWFMMEGISTVGHYAWLSFFSPMRAVDQEALLAGYQPINFMGYPVSWLLSGSIFFVVLFFCSLAGIRGSSMTSGDAPVKRNRDVFHRKTGRISLLKKSIFCWEWKKSFLIERGCFILIAGMIIVGFSYRPVKEWLNSPTEYYYKEIINKYHGDYTKEKETELLNTEKELRDLQEDVEKNGENYSATAFAVASKELERTEAIQNTIKYGEYIKRHTNAKMVYEKGYSLLLGDAVSGSYLKWCDALGIFLMVFLAIRMWGMETWYEMKSLCTATKRGMRSVTKRKWSITGVYAVVIGMIVYIPWIYQAQKTYSLCDWSVSAQSIRQCAAFGDLPVGVLITAGYLLRICYIFLVGVLGRYVQKKIESQIFSMLVTVMPALLPLVFFS